MLSKSKFLSHRLSKRLDFDLETNSKIQNTLASIDNLKGQWQQIKNASPQYLNSLKTSVIASSTGSSTRIEGAKLTDVQVEEMLKHSKMRKLITRDEQEVAGYLEVLQDIFDGFKNIEFSERTIKQIHSIVLKYSEKDTRHRGGYKITSNEVVLVDEFGKIIGSIFKPAVAEETPEMMRDLVEWTQNAFQNQIFHPLLITANFIFEFLSIHPFKDGNGRVSRVLVNLMLLQQGYDFTQYISHEKLVEETKVEYYLALRKTTKTWRRDRENMSFWMIYILNLIKKQADLAIRLISDENPESYLSKSQNRVWKLFLNTNTLSRSQIAHKTKMPLGTVESAIRKLLEMGKIERLGEGRATRYRKRV